MGKSYCILGRIVAKQALANKRDLFQKQQGLSSMNWEKMREAEVDQHSKIQISISFRIGKNSKYSLRARFKSRNFESIDEMELIS